MPSRKRSIHEVDGDVGNDSQSLLQRIRGMWQFANLCQWIYIFGKAAKLDDSVDIEEIETSCLKPDSELLRTIALALLKLVSSHRGITLDILDDQLRKQFMSKAPGRNPFGDDDNPVSFAQLDIFTKITVLQQLTQWVMIHPERIREKMAEQKDVEQTDWRIEPYGWDRDDRIYYVLDDNRVYRFSEPQAEITPPKRKKTKSDRAGRRSSKRQRGYADNEDSDGVTNEDNGDAADSKNTLGGGSWECIAVTLQEVRAFLDTLVRTRDENERVLRRQLEDHLVPILEKQEEAMNRRQLQRERELLNLAKMANAKRSSRIADKVEKQKREDEEKEEEKQRLEAEETERRNAQALLEQEQEREIRLLARQRRLKEREARRLRHEEELAQLSEDSKTASDSVRVSDRRLQAEIERNKQALRELEQEEDDWVFDCICGLYGQVDDGAHSVACEKCNVWQHSKCLAIAEAEAESPAFHFICGSCQRRQEEAKLPKTVIKLKVRPSTAAHEPSSHEPSKTTDEDKLKTMPEHQTTNAKEPRLDGFEIDSISSKTTSAQAPTVMDQFVPRVGHQHSMHSPERLIPSVDDIQGDDKEAVNANHQRITQEEARTATPATPNVGTLLGNQHAETDLSGNSPLGNISQARTAMALQDSIQTEQTPRGSGDVSQTDHQAISHTDIQNATIAEPQAFDNEQSRSHGVDEKQPVRTEAVAATVLKQDDALQPQETST